MEAAPSTAAEPRDGAPVDWRAVASALPDAALAGAFLVVWVDPFALGPEAVHYFLLTLLLEFIIVHSAAFMGSVALSPRPRDQRVTSLLGLGAFYTVFVAGFALSFRAWWPVWSFWGLTLNRMLGVILRRGPAAEERLRLRAGWGLSAAFYLVGAMLTIVLPVPELGVDAAARARLDLPGGGLWIDEPHRVLAFGTLYFGLTAASELWGWDRRAALARRSG